jgi:thiol-disulfide isomerase/thioredoxin
MHSFYKIFSFIKPFLLVILIVAVLKTTGQLGNVASIAQSTVLKTGLMNAGDEADVEEDFDFNFTAYSLDGKLLTKDSLKNKVVFLNMWATWCGPCRAEMPTIQSLHDGIKNDNIVFVMLAIDRVDPERKVKNYIAKSNYTFPVYILKGEPPVQMRVPTIPTTFIISKEGKLLRKEVGMKNYDTERFKNFLLKEAE